MLKQINTKYFGVYSYEEKDVLHFENGLFGFEEEKEFLLLRIRENNEDVLCLQSTQQQDIAFFAVNPFTFLPEYRPVPTEKEMASIDARGIGDLLFYVICNMTDDICTSTANLKCPIIVNLHNKKSAQVILENPDYQFRHAFTELVPTDKEGEASC